MTRRHWRIPVPIAGVALLSGCVSIDQIAPPVAGSAQLAEGRRIYTTQCTTCHVAEPVKKYTRSDWERILPEMVIEAKLDTTQATALEAYLRAAVALPQG